MAMMDDEERPPKGRQHEIGMVLDSLSLDELDRRIALLESEIARLREAIAAKRSTRAAADAVFKL